MRRTLLLVLAALIFISPAARADHIGMFSDATGVTCVLAAGMNNSVTFIHTFATGATGSRFRVDLATAPGSVYYSFSTPFTPAGTLNDDLSLSYGECLSGSFTIGTMVALLTPGQVFVRPASGLSNIIFTNCAFADGVASGGQASIGDSQCAVAGTKSATWGEIKSLYR